MHGSTILVVREDYPFAFTIGWIRPKIILSAGLLQLLTAGEQKAVIYHEMHHSKSLDPLKIFILSLIKDLFWYIPITKYFLERYQLLSELSADNYAVKTMQSRIELGSALLKLIKRGWVDFPVNWTSFLSSITDYRLQQLMEPSDRLKMPLKPNSKSVFTSSMVLMIFLSMMLGGCS